MMKKILLGAVASVLCMAASAEDRNPLMDFLHGTYNGGSLGHTTISDYCQPGSYVCNDQRDVSFKVYGGLRMTDYLGSEIGFISFGRIRNLSQPGGTFGAGAIYERTTRTNGFVFDFAPVFAFSPKASVITRFGVARWHIEGDDGPTHFFESKTAPYLGAAFDYKVRDFVPEALSLLKPLSVQLSWDASPVEFLGDHHWYNMISIGTQLEF